MLKLFTSKLPNLIATVAVAFTVTACVATSPYDKGAEELPAPEHKHILLLKTERTLEQSIAPLLKSPFTNIYSGQIDGTYILTLSKKSAQTNLLGKPQLFGVLRKETRPTSFITGYQLTAFNGKVLAQGELVTVGESQTVITPSISHSAKLTPEVVADIAEQLQPILKQALYPRPWQAVVIGKKDYRHVIIQSGKEEGVKVGEMFGAPNGASLQVVTFENGRAVLTVLEGLLPANDSVLQLVKK